MKRNNWDLIKQSYPLGKIIEGRVISHKPFGVFVDIGHENLMGIIPVIDFLEDDNSMRLYPNVDSNVNCLVIGYTEDDSNQIWLSVNPSVLSGDKLPFGIKFKL